MFTVRRKFDCPPEDVFAVLEDGWLYPVWVVGASRMRQVDDQWPQPGSQLHHSVGVWPALLDDKTVVLEWDPPRRMRLRAKGWPIGEAKVELTVTSVRHHPEDDHVSGVDHRPGIDPDLEVDHGCEVSISEDVSAGPAKFVPAPIRAVGMNLRNRETLRRLAYIAENRPSA